MQKITIAIDGYSSTGKSTIARQIARELGYIYIDTGAMYRAITLFALQNKHIGPSGENISALIALLPSIRLDFKLNVATGIAEMYLNGENEESAIRTLEVSGYVSKIAAISEVRRKLVAMQRELGKGKGVVMDGRDIGTVVFPDAELKLFLIASPEVRAQRRYRELLEKGDTVTYEDVLKNVRERDYIDSHREDSPLKKAPDAIKLDTTHMRPEEQFERIHTMVLQTIEKTN